MKTKSGAKITIQRSNDLVNDYEEQKKRIEAVFGAKEIPTVKRKTLRIYFEYLKRNLPCPCVLTGIESMGYLSWEEPFEFGYGTKAEYNRLRQEHGSHHDKYELKTFDAWVGDEDIVVNVYRSPHHKQFTIPLSELQAADEESQTYQLLNDYSVWFVNWH